MRRITLAAILILLVVAALPAYAQDSQTVVHPTTGDQLTIDLPAEWLITLPSSGDFAISAPDGSYIFIFYPELELSAILDAYELADDSPLTVVVDAAAEGVAAGVDVEAAQRFEIGTATVTETRATSTVEDSNGIQTTITTVGIVTIANDDHRFYSTTADATSLGEDYESVHRDMLTRFAEAEFVTAEERQSQILAGLEQIFVSDSGAVELRLPAEWQAVAHEHPDYLEIEVRGNPDDNSAAYIAQLDLLSATFALEMGFDADTPLEELIRFIGPFMLRDVIPAEATIHAQSEIRTYDLAEGVTFSTFLVSSSAGNLDKVTAFGLLQTADGSVFFVEARQRGTIDFDTFAENHSIGVAIFATLQLDRAALSTIEIDE